MKKLLALLSSCIFFISLLHAQEILPGISVKNMGGNIIVSWKNEYQKPISILNIQRSYDSLQNYTTIGSVLNPQNAENGYTDAAAPYQKMYYRLFIGFEGGAYLITKPVRPTKDTAFTASHTVRYPWQTDPNADPGLQLPPTATGNSPIPAGQPAIPSWVPSKLIFTAKDNNVAVLLPQAATQKYQVKFFNENEQKIFELNNPPDEYLIIEKVNFKKAGWYHFEIWLGGKLIEKNKFYIARDGKITNDTPKRLGNR